MEKITVEQELIQSKDLQLEDKTVFEENEMPNNLDREEKCALENTISEDNKTEDLISKRNGNFKVKISYSELKFIRNILNNKIEWKGQNEAYLIAISILSIDSFLKEMDPKSQSIVDIEMPATLIESIYYFLSKVTGIGLDSAQKLINVNMAFRQAIEEIKKIDIELQKNEKS